jgi:hypothetical protein
MRESAKLFPNGLAIVNASLVAEAGSAERVAKLLARQPELADYLAEIPVRDGTALALVERWIAAGKQIAKLERERAALAAKEATTPRDSSALTRLRFEWIRLVGLVLGNLAASRASAEAIATLRGPVLEASERAGRRYAAGMSAAAMTSAATMSSAAAVTSAATMSSAAAVTSAAANGTPAPQTQPAAIPEARSPAALAAAG